MLSIVPVLHSLVLLHVDIIPVLYTADRAAVTVSSYFKNIKVFIF